ncbi:hypothetical protein [Tissierella simiarum]|nr:hypothetical protein [Tissierella simiarum]
MKAFRKTEKHIIANYRDYQMTNIRRNVITKDLLENKILSKYREV